jgi:hypothetical protein
MRLYVLGSRSTVLHVLILHYRLRSVFSFTPWPIYTWLKYPFVTVDRELCEYQINMYSAAKGKSCIPVREPNFDFPAIQLAISTEWAVSFLCFRLLCFLYFTFPIYKITLLD